MQLGEQVTRQRRFWSIMGIVAQKPKEKTKRITF